MMCWKYYLIVRKKKGKERFEWNTVNKILYLGPTEYLIDNKLTSFYSAISIELQGNNRTYKQTQEVLS